VYFQEITDICCSFWYFLSQITNVFSCVWGQLIHHDKEKPHCGCIAGICSGIFLILRPCLFVCWECLFWLLSFLSLSFFFLTILFVCLLCFWWGFCKHNTYCGNGFPSYGLRYCGRFTAQSCCVSYQNGRDLWQDVIDVSEPLDQDEVSTSLIFCCQKINPSCNFRLLQHFADLGDSSKGCLLILVIFLCP